LTQSELQDIASEKLDTSLTSTKDKYCTFDAHGDDYVIELKCRRAHYDTQLIEYKKFIANIDQANESGKEFLYIISTPRGEYVFNVSKLAANGYDFGWEDRRMPSNTDFAGTQHKDKRVGYISTSVSS
tara:strand:- start:4786 stop:5169 length:384 start_codon:yes stop_codon:yes gene_type:complete